MPGRRTWGLVVVALVTSLALGCREEPLPPTANDACIGRVMMYLSISGSESFTALVGDTVRATIRRQPWCLPAPGAAYQWDVSPSTTLMLVAANDSVATFVARDTGAVAIRSAIPRDDRYSTIGTLRIVAAR